MYLVLMVPAQGSRGKHMFDLTIVQVFGIVLPVRRTYVRVTPVAYGDGVPVPPPARRQQRAGRTVQMANSVRRPIRVAVLLTLVVLAIVLLLATAVRAAPSSSDGAGSFVSHRVVSGDTLWEIAAVYTAPGDDIRRTVFEIRQANEIDGSIILPGQELRVPVG